MNRKKILKIISILIVLLIINTNQIVSFASITSSQNKGKIKVSNIEEGVNVYLYQIATMEYDYANNQPREGYSWTSPIKNWIESEHPDYSDTKKFYDEIQSNTEESRAFYDKLTSSIKNGTIVLSEYRSMEATRNDLNTSSNLKGEAEFKNVDMGTYLVIIENGYMVYTPSVVNLIPTYEMKEDNQTGEWVLNDADVVVKATMPTITKTITDTVTKEEKTVDNYSTIDEITYSIKADIPTYLENSLSKKYYISDKLDSSLTMNEDTVTIVGLKTGCEPESISGYAINFDTTRPNSTDNVTFSINFDYEQIKSYESIQIVYTAKLNQNSDLILGSDGNKNYAYLDYSNNPYDSTILQTQSSETTVYTYDIEIKSVDTDGTTPLFQSEFSLYDSDNKILYFVKGNDGEYYLANSEENNATTTLTVNSEGKVHLYGLDEGTYTVKQTKAPDGYNISNKTFDVVLKDNEPDGILDDDYELIFPNTKGFTLPITGGSGIIALISMGVVIIGIGTIIFISTFRKRKIKNNNKFFKFNL